MSYEAFRERYAAEVDRIGKGHRNSGNIDAANVCEFIADNIRAIPLPEVTDVEALRKENEQLREALIDLISIVKIHQDATKNRFALAEIDCAEEALKGGEV